MPIYEYRCNQCRRRSSVLVRSFNPPASVQCDSCGSGDVVRLVSRFAYHRSEADRLADVDTSQHPTEDYYRDSRNLGLWAKKRAKEIGADEILAPHFDEIIENAQKKTKEMLSD